MSERGEELRNEAVIAVFVRARSLPGRPIPDALIVAAAADAGALPLLTFDRDQRRYGVATETP
jgi:predicted nucleic acid-binding protein